MASDGFVTNSIVAWIVCRYLYKKVTTIFNLISRYIILKRHTWVKEIRINKCCGPNKFKRSRESMEAEYCN